MGKINYIKNYRCPLCDEYGTLEHIKVMHTPYVGDDLEITEVNIVRCSHCTYEVMFKDFMNNAYLYNIAVAVKRI